jgi:hypothetical protein
MPRGSVGSVSRFSPELGGSNSIKNLWPESHRTSPWNAQVKDRLEDKLHELVCGGQLDLKTAQRAIASNWIEAYKKYVSPNPEQIMSFAQLLRTGVASQLAIIQISSSLFSKRRCHITSSR